ncbi:CopG family transcriptional regulator [Nocardioides zhouii]|uniref:CopG family transcriptional regulator n=1 Tax=Nocardioides zhouii TaxID=1168729 RepID=A0A4Q2T1A7_9ACTN|nr:CopG family transcriptional regulator [Nocardioides zhouii]RYC10488.1 CopG family transcriptional regulator [Nocardioides zhouii]
MNARITVSLPEDLVEAAIAAVASGQAPSVSAYVAGALREKADRESVAEVLAEWLVEAGPLSVEDEAWVQDALSKAQLGT